MMKSNGVIKFKPVRSPRILESWSSQKDAKAKNTVKNSKNAVLHSQELVAQSKEIMAKIGIKKKKYS